MDDVFVRLSERYECKFCSIGPSSVNNLCNMDHISDQFKFQYMDIF